MRKIINIIVVIALMYSPQIFSKRSNHSDIMGVSLLNSLYLKLYEFSKVSDLTSAYAFKKLTDRGIGSDLIEVSMDASVRTLYMMRNGTVDKKTFIKSIKLLNFILSKNKSFAYSRVSPCYDIQAELYFTLSHIKRDFFDIEQLSIIKLNIYLLTEEEKNKKNLKSDKVYCKKSVNEYLQDKGIMEYLRKVDISPIKVELRKSKPPKGN